MNRAVAGRSIQTWLREPAVSTQKSGSECALTSQDYNARWTAMLDPATGMKAGDTLLIQFGINDGDSACPRHVGTDLYATYLKQMADAAKARGAQAVFLTPTSAIECSGATAVATRGFLATIKESGSKNGVPVIDLHQLSIDLYNQLGFCPNDGNYSAGKVGQFFCEDHTHFDAPGAKQIARVVADALKAKKLPIAGYLK
jgi:lysophospholipase L1-like esterase